jgi:hypothetical protein
LPHSRAALFLSSSLAFQPEDKAVVSPDFDIVILNEPLCAHHGFTIVAANECFKLDTPAVFGDPAEAILWHVIACSAQADAAALSGGMAVVTAAWGMRAAVMVQVRVRASNYLLNRKATPANDHSFPFAFSRTLQGGVGFNRPLRHAQSGVS